jgi:hypothetical protein
MQWSQSMKHFMPLPQRPGTKPKTTPQTPHQQLDQISPVELQERLWQRMLTLPCVFDRPSGISVHGTRALWLQDPTDRAAFMIGAEFAHLHPAYDGSLHMTLDPASHAIALAGGWAEPHPLAGRYAPTSTVLVYGARDEYELEILWWLVQQSWRHASGLDPLSVPEALVATGDPELKPAVTQAH